MRLSREFIESKIKWWELVLRVWDRCDVQKGDSENTAACKLYIRNQTTKGLRTDLVHHGYKLPYTLKISDLITQNDIDDREMMLVARALFKANKEHSSLS